MARGNNKGQALKIATREEANPLVVATNDEVVLADGQTYKIIILNGERVPLPKDSPAKPDRDPNAVAIATREREKAVAIEPKVTSDMIRIARELGGTNEGLEFRLKTTDSLARKIADDSRMDNLTQEEAAAKIGDLMRYTINFPEKDYTRSLEATVKKLVAEGYEVRVKNFWKPGDPYQGVNMMLTKNGVKQELQIHTPESFRVKQFVTHKDYEAFRARNPDGSWKHSREERLAMFIRMRDIVAKIPHPKDYDKMMKIGSTSFHDFTH